MNWRGLWRNWNIVLASVLVMLGFGGAYLSFGVFIKPILEEFLWTRASIAGASSATLAISGLVSLVVGRLADRYGIKELIIIASLLCGSGYVLMSQLSSIWQLYFYFGIIVGTGMAVVWISIMTAISRRYIEKRVMAIGIVMSGTSIGGMIMPPLTVYWIMSYEWRSACIFLAIIVLLIIIPAMILPGRITKQTVGMTYNKNSELQETAISSGLSALEAAKTVPFWMLITIGVTQASCFFLIIVHIVPYAIDLQVLPTLAAVLLTIVSGASILGRLAAGFIADKIGGRLAIIFLCFLQAIALFMLMQANSLWVFYMAALVFGFGSGGVSPIRVSMVPEFFGMRAVGTLLGFGNVAWCLGGAIGPVLGGYIFDLSKSYDIAFLVSILLIMIAMVATSFLRAPKI